MAQTATSSDPGALVRRLIHGLSQPPAQPGLRLRSERELALRLGIGRRRIGCAINRLVEAGVLVRRGGSGTFLQRVPQAGLPAPGSALLATDLFSDPDALEQPATNQRLTLGLWWESLNHLSRTDRLILDAMLVRAQELGHVLSLHSIERSISSATDLAHQVARQRPDGLLLSFSHLTSGPGFQQTLQSLWGALPPVLYTFSASLPFVDEPLIFFDTHAAIERAVHLLAASGYQRIALIALPRWQRMAEQYALAMAQHGLSYRAVAMPEVSWPLADELVPELPAIRDGQAQITGLLELPQPPDALYVADDVMMLGVAQVLQQRGLTPGKDLGLITHWVPGKTGPPQQNWSRMEFDTRQLARAAVDQLIARVHHPKDQPMNLALHANWVPGQTHQRLAHQ